MRDVTSIGGSVLQRIGSMRSMWVERGESPGQITATAGPMSPWPGRTRRPCAYPKVSHFSGKDSIEDAAQFRCE